MCLPFALLLSPHPLPPFFFFPFFYIYILIILLFFSFFFCLSKFILDPAQLVELSSPCSSSSSIRSSKRDVELRAARVGVTPPASERDGEKSTPMRSRCVEARRARGGVRLSSELPAAVVEDSVFVAAIWLVIPSELKRRRISHASELVSDEPFGAAMAGATAEPRRRRRRELRVLACRRDRAAK
jgi:hypothetical protein